MSFVQKLTVRHLRFSNLGHLHLWLQRWIHRDVSVGNIMKIKFAEQRDHQIPPDFFKYVSLLLPSINMARSPFSC